MKRILKFSIQKFYVIWTANFHNSATVRVSGSSYIALGLVTVLLEYTDLYEYLNFFRLLQAKKYSNIHTILEKSCEKELAIKENVARVNFYH